MNARLLHSIERLEDRIAPAGLISVAYAAGHLAIDGDIGDHSLSIDFSDGALHLHGFDGTSLLFNGKAATDSVTIPAFAGSIKATLGAGNDTVRIGPGAFPGDVALDLGGGTNRVVAGDLSVAGNLAITGAAGADRVEFAGSHTTVGGDVSLDLGEGRNSVASGLGSFVVGGKLGVKTGGGSDSLVFGGSDYLIGGDTTVTTGAGSDIVGFFATKIGAFGGKLNVSGTSAAGQGEHFTFSGDEQVLFRGAIAIVLGAGDGAVALHSAGKLHAQSDVSINAGHGSDTASVTAKDVTVDGNVTVKTAGSSDVKIAGSDTLNIAGNVKITGGSGTDHVTISGGGTIAGTVTVDVGAGDAQSITLAGTANQSLILKSAVSLIQGGTSGTSVTNLAAITALSSVSVTSKSASDTITISDVTFDGTTSFTTIGGTNLASLGITPLTPINPLSGLISSPRGLSTTIATPLADHAFLGSGSVLTTPARIDLGVIGLTGNLDRLVLAPLSVETAL